jgi:deoxyadenosine/deoxycytidine kinase
MGKLITVAGNLGAGKTTLTKLICDKGSFTPYWEKPEEHPFQKDFMDDLRRWALTNQMDFLLSRCEQELLIRRDNQIAVMDGGFDQDFHVFTKNLYSKGFLITEEFRICERFYHLIRSFLSPPDIIIRIIIDTPTLLQRRLKRVRKTVDLLFNPQEFADLELLLDGWLKGEASSPVLLFPFEHDLNHCTDEIDGLIRQIKSILNTSPGQSDGNTAHLPKEI